MTDNQENKLFDYVNNFFQDKSDKFDVNNDGDVNGEDSAIRKSFVEIGNSLKNSDGENFANKMTRSIDDIDNMSGNADEILDGIKSAAPSFDEIGEFIGGVFNIVRRFL
ncbi:hypothetical protein H6G64_27610 [Calothrix sp. FACHB-156]|nr:hypothetical protein [Calothrix sp. FACHB-156]